MGLEGICLYRGELLCGRKYCSENQETGLGGGVLPSAPTLLLG